MPEIGRDLPARRKRSCVVFVERSKSCEKNERDPKKSGGLLRQGGEPPSPQVIYGFVQAEKANHRVNAMCRVLKVSKRAAFMAGEAERALGTG